MRLGQEVFTTMTKFYYKKIVGRVRELAFLNPYVMITLMEKNLDATNITYKEYHYAGSLVEIRVVVKTCSKAP